MKVFDAIIVSVTFVFAPLLGCQPQANSTSTPNTHSIQVTRKGNTEPFCPPKELREERFCPDRETRESTRFGCTPLMRAAEGGNLVQVRALLDKGADVNHPAPHWGHTALMLAAGKDQLEVVKILLKAGANPNAVAFGHGGIPGWAWMFAMDRCNRHWLEMTEAMLAAGVALNPKTIYPSPLGYAIDEKDTVMIQALLKRGADVNLADSQTGDTLLMSAAKYSTPEVVQVLIEAGANVNAKNKLGQTALTIADNKDNSWRREIVALLIEHGAKN
jgi:ankyrin repeat protein